jgi:hypothetical protein
MKRQLVVREWSMHCCARQRQHAPQGVGDVTPILKHENGQSGEFSLFTHFPHFVRKRVLTRTRNLLPGASRGHLSNRRLRMFRFGSLKGIRFYGGRFADRGACLQPETEDSVVEAVRPFR